MVADEEGAAGVRRGGLFTSDDFLTCEGLSAGGVAAAGARMEDLLGRHPVPLGLAKDCRAKAPPRPGKALLVEKGRICRADIRCFYDLRRIVGRRRRRGRGRHCWCEKWRICRADIRCF